MSQRHKHYDAIVAWAEGKQLQYKVGGAWMDCNKHYAPSFMEGEEYRVKPKTIKYRVCILDFAGDGRTPRPHPLAVEWEDNGMEDRERWSSFVRWVTDWQEVEV